MSPTSSSLRMAVPTGSVRDVSHPAVSGDVSHPARTGSRRRLVLDPRPGCGGDQARPCPPALGHLATFGKFRGLCFLVHSMLEPVLQNLECFVLHQNSGIMWNVL